MNRIEGADGLTWEGLSRADANVRRDLHQVPVGRGLPKLVTKEVKLSGSRWSLAFGSGKRSLRFQERQRGTQRFCGFMNTVSDL